MNTVQNQINNCLDFIQDKKFMAEFLLANKGFNKIGIDLGNEYQTFWLPEEEADFVFDLQENYV